MRSAEVLFAGFGGHGMLLSGRLLAQAAMNTGRHVSWLPSYGPEMRGGTANVTVCISEREVGSPYIEHPTALLVMNQPSLEKFGSRVRAGGLIVINRSLVPIDFHRPDCTVLNVDAGEISSSLGTARASNLVLLGAFCGWSNVVPRELLSKIIADEFALKARFVAANVAAFEAGYDKGLLLRKGDDDVAAL